MQILFQNSEVIIFLNGKIPTNKMFILLYKKIDIIENNILDFLYSQEIKTNQTSH